MSSLRGRLLAGTTVAVAAVLALAGTASYALVARTLVDEVDRALLGKARLLASTVEQEGSELELAFEELDMWEFAGPERGGFLQLWRASGETLYRSPSLGEHRLELPAQASEPVTRWVDLPTGARGRAVGMHFQPRLERADSGAPPAQLALELSRDVREVQQALATMRGLLVSVGLITLLVAGAVLVWVVRRSLRPVAAVSERIAALGEEDLSEHLDVAGVPEELVPVVQRVNGLLTRLRSAFARERAFSNDVAHELRTPLAGLRTTLEVAGARPRNENDYASVMRESSAMVAALQAIVERLLQLARLDAHRSNEVPQRHDLADLVLDGWEHFTSQAVSRDLRVDLRLQDGLEVSADRELLGLVLRNLYENAVSYADTGGEIRISTRREDCDEVVHEVTNSGSLLDQDEAAAATQRFWRGDAARANTGLHCGLGLALADKAARALRGRLELRSRKGGEFVATVTLPGSANQD